MELKGFVDVRAQLKGNASGIHSMELKASSPSSRARVARLRIHSMELKVRPAAAGNRDRPAVKNPFNGIERMATIRAPERHDVQVESIQWN